jgi:hypothetical protein
MQWIFGTNLSLNRFKIWILQREVYWKKYEYDQVSTVYISGQYCTSQGVWLKFNRKYFFVGNVTVLENSTIRVMNKIL